MKKGGCKKTKSCAKPAKPKRGQRTAKNKMKVRGYK